jgi:hypothetical protein
MSVPSALPTLPPLATVFRFASVTENSSGKLVRLDAPETSVWATVTGLRLLHDGLYHGAFCAIAPEEKTATMIDVRSSGPKVLAQQPFPSIETPLSLRQGSAD